MPRHQTKGNKKTMVKEPFTATIKSEKVSVYQNTHTGLFYTISPDGKHTPIDYHLIRTQTTSMQRLKYWRNRYGYTQAELAELIHVSSPAIIMMWETGLRHPLRKHQKLLNSELSHDIFTD